MIKPAAVPHPSVDDLPQVAVEGLLHVGHLPAEDDRLRIEQVDGGGYREARVIGGAVEEVVDGPVPRGRGRLRRLERQGLPPREELREPGASPMRAACSHRLSTASDEA